MIVEHPEKHLAHVFAGLKAIGYWRPTEEMIAFDRDWVRRFGGRRSREHLEALPNPRDFIDLSWPEVERQRVAAYLDKGRVLYAYDGFSQCRICEMGNGGKCLTDGVFVWPSGFSHYITAHSVKPPAVFLQHIYDADQLAPSSS